MEQQKDSTKPIHVRKALGKIMIEDIICIGCKHNRCKIFLSKDSPKFGKHKCTKCGAEW